MKTLIALSLASGGALAVSACQEAPHKTDPPAKPVTPPAKPVAPKPAQPVAGSVQFTRINYDASGKDKKTSKSMNGEWVRLTNKTRNTINLNGWTVRDAGGHVYRFNGNTYLGAARSVYVHTGGGRNNTPFMHRYWGSGNHVWNNNGDTAVLRTNTGKTIDSCRWTSNRKATSRRR